MEDIKLWMHDTYMKHELGDSWTLWAHLPHDTDWSVKSYKKILTFNTIEQAVALYETIPSPMMKNCMLFLMRDGIQPMWEDPKNKDGGCFSYKIKNNQIEDTWKKVSYMMLGGTITKSNARINGATISPKKNFSILKIWLASCSVQNPQVIEKGAGLVSNGCIFKRHIA